MAKFEYVPDDGMDAALERLGREGIRAIVMAGAAAAVKEMQDDIGAYRHVKTGNMQKAVGPGAYHEDLGSAWVEVYPQGSDDRGVSNAKKAFVINYGYGGRRTKKTGDKFITGNKKKREQAVGNAMQAESGRLIDEMNR
jgi:hypothetical protein